MQSLRCNLQAEMSPGNSQEISYTFPRWPSSATENSRGTFHEGTEPPPEAAARALSGISPNLENISTGDRGRNGATFCTTFFTL